MKTIEDTADSTDEAHRLATAMWDALADPLTETTMPTLLSAAERFLSTVHTYDTLALSRAYRAADDARFPTATFRPKDYADGLEVVRAAASDAGRDPTSIIPATWLFVVTGGSRDEVDEALGPVAMKAFALNAPANVWARHGASHPMGDDFTSKTSFRKRSTNRPCCPIRLKCRRRC
jgi:hypothetical protein